MDHDVHSFAQSWAYAREALAAKWTPAILATLVEEPLHYKDILREVRDHHCGPREYLHEGILTKSLKTMVEHGLIRRTQIAGVFPPSVTYTITTAARELLVAAQPLAQWAKRHDARSVVQEIAPLEAADAAPAQWAVGL